MNSLVQTPSPGSCLVCHRGDELVVSLTVTGAHDGSAWLRTNLGRGAVRRLELIAQSQENRSLLARDWHDLRMQSAGPGRFHISLPLLEVGCFDIKSFYLPVGATDPVWPAGENTSVKVEPADACCGNTIYAAFVRQFGPERTRRHSSRKNARTLARLDSEGYSVVPPSGTFRDLIRNLDFIMGKMQFHIIQLLPIHPIPTTYGRMGRFGSPFAVLDFMDVDPALAEFDRQSTPMEQFQELVHAVHARQGKLFIDIPINHTGWASWLQVHHPEWFARNEDRTFQSPGAWGVTWADLSRLNYDGDRGLWIHIAEVFLYWARRGVDGFRCDAGYMVPLPVWAYVVARVRHELPDTLFLLEGLGGSMDTVEQLLCRAGLDWAYSELFQNYDRAQVQGYVPFSVRVTESKGLQVHFAETHDNNRLAARSLAYARLRTAVSALFSQEGGFGITNGVEWFATEKVNVHGAAALNWGAETNQVQEIRALNQLLYRHPAFHARAKLSIVPSRARSSVALLRQPNEDSHPLLVLANLSEREADVLSWHAPDTPGIDATRARDLLTGRVVALTARDGVVECELEPAQILCLTSNESDLRKAHPDDVPHGRAGNVPRRIAQRLRAKAWDVHAQFHSLSELAAAVPDLRENDLARDPRRYCAAAAGGDLAPVVSWQWPRDQRRTVMVPPGCFLLVTASTHFMADLREGDRVVAREFSLPGANDSQFALFLPLPQPAEGHRLMTLRLEIFQGFACVSSENSVLYLGLSGPSPVQSLFRPEDIERGGTYALLTNGTGAMAQVRGFWTRIESQYDALLVGNLNPDFPVDRHLMLTRCRAWLVFRGYSQAVNRNCLQSFSLTGAGRARWRFDVPCGMGKSTGLDVELELHEGQNAVSLSFARRKAESSGADALEDGYAIRIILRPDVEDRNCHLTTKAYAGPEQTWPGAVSPIEAGFRFAPVHDRALEMAASTGRFTVEPEWTYMVAHPFEQERGQEGSSDLFSPGYFACELHGGTQVVLKAHIVTPDATPSGAARPPGLRRDPVKGALQGQAWPLKDALRRAIGDFIVRRDDSLTVIAGYPWFLDWGRDTLICLRGIIAAGMVTEARDILLQFARFENDGTLPNMIRGEDDSNRDTSDAPLWFLVACADLLGAAGRNLLDADCRGRSLREVLLSIGRGYMHGTRNGIRMDPESGLVFSPSHFTWMDTNHPAGTPRQGYPVEIQALWYAALHLLARLDKKGPWAELAKQVRRSVQTYYASPERGYLADCLHATPGLSAAMATPDDHLRPNQLLAITLGLVDGPGLCGRILTACEELLIPGAIRSLADRPVSYPLPITRGGRHLNDPLQPYWGRYQGDEDTRRKPAYHNGTAWTWQFPSYAEALFKVYGERSRTVALSILASSTVLINQGCAGHLPEIVDGDFPHTLRGCGAQAWGATELYRVLDLLETRPAAAAQ